MKFAIEEACRMLGQTPAVLRSMLAGVPPRWTSRNEGGTTWSPFDVVGHLIDGEETDWMPRARIILSHGVPAGSSEGTDARLRAARTFAPFDRSRHLSINKGQSLDALLAKFKTLRLTNVATLRALNLTPAQLALCGIHPEFGEVTLEQLLATWVVHDFDHLGQIARTVARQYADAVGPWRAYLRIIQ